MTKTPNTPAELKAMAERPDSPYFRQPVIDALDAVSPSRGATPGDAQAAIEVILERLMYWISTNIDQMDEDDSDCECRAEFARMLRDLKLAERLIEDIHLRDFCFNNDLDFTPDDDK